MESFYTHNLNPNLRFFGESFPIYWLTYPVGFFLIYFLGNYVLNKFRTSLEIELSGDSWARLLVLTWFAVLFGGRVGYILFYDLNYFLERPEQIFNLVGGGMSFHGALMGAGLYLYFFVHPIKSRLNMMDLLALCSPLAIFLGRVANFINAELPGRPSQMPWAVIFPGVDGVPRHPSQIYEALLEGVLLFFILWSQRHRLKFPGSLTLQFVFFYGLLRFLVEFFRRPDPHIGKVLLGLSLGQCFCIFMMLTSSFLFFHSAQQKDNPKRP